MTREEEARQTLAEVEQAGGTGILVQGDVSKPAEAAAMVAATREALGPIDLLAHCAGMAVVEPADETRWESDLATWSCRAPETDHDWVL